MRDGQALAADLYLPDVSGTYPVVLIQTPYNKNLFRLGLPLHVGQNLAQSRFAFVVLDWRCHWASSAACMPGSTRGQDGFDAVEWIAMQPWCTGKVATWGLSALGNIQFMTARERPPHLVCAVPVVCAPQSRYSQFYPGGVALPQFVKTLNTLFNGAFNLVPQNPYYNLYWQIAENITYYPGEVEVPMLHIAGWFDHNLEDMLRWYEAMRRESPAGDAQWLLIGPWTHDGVFSTGQGDLSFPDAGNTAHDMARAFLLHYLLEEDNGWQHTHPVTYFQTGDDQWFTTDSFPSQEGQASFTFYLTEDQSLSPFQPSMSDAIRFRYDPLDPSPTVGGKTLSFTLEQGPMDQSTDVESRDDILLFTTTELEQDMVLQGQITLHLHVSSDRTDTDFAIRLTEVYPDGRSIALGQISQRMRFRSGYTMLHEQLMTPGVVYPVTLRFDHLAHTFKAGNRIRLVVSSSNYPWFNRNMNNGGVMYPDANLDTVVNPLIAHNHVHIGAFPSRMVIPEIGVPSAASDARSLPLRIFPSPAGEYVMITGAPPGAQGMIYDATGKVCRHIVISEAKEKLDIHQLLPGTYVVTLIDGKRQWSGKFSVMQHRH